MRRFVSVICIFALLVGFVPIMPCQPASASVAMSNAQRIQNGVTLHCWNWSYANIETNMAKIAEQGYTAVQVSPIQQSKQGTKGDYMSVWWVFYQPASFSIDNTGSSALGTKADFERMCRTAHKYGISVIVDVVANHMGDNGANKKSPAIIDDLEKDASCWHDISRNIDNYYSRYNITRYCMDGVPDLNTGNQKVQNYVLNFLKECIDAGADGFRFDAVKHIETPDDDASIASNFWPTVINGAKVHARNTRDLDLYCYGELLFHPDEGGSLPDSAYTKYFSVTDNSWSNMIRNNVIGNGSAGSFSHSYHKDASPSKLVLWAESHDNYAGDGSKSMSVQNINKTWALVAARADAMGLYLARPNNFYPQKLGEATPSGWNYDEVRAVNRFHNVFAGESEYVSQQNGIAYVERGSEGAILVNCSGNETNVSVKANRMADGTYKDQITGNTFRVSGGTITGRIGSTGIAVVYNAEECSHQSHDKAGLCTACRTYVGHSYDANDRCSCGQERPQGRTVYFSNTAGWSNVNIYSWYTEGGEITGSWPGDPMTEMSDGIYTYTLPPEAENVIFNNGSVQTGNLLVPDAASNLNMYHYGSGTWQVYGEDESPAGYYLFGYINGADYACEADAANMGDYRFEDGKLIATFTKDSYVAVKRENNTAWYMTDGWLGTDVTSAKLYHTDITGENSNKLFVPGGVELLFTLKENNDGSLTLSYEKTAADTYSVSGSLEGISETASIAVYSGDEAEPVAVTECIDGTFSVGNLPQGSYTLTATCTGYVSRSYSFELEGDTELEIVLCQQGDSNGDGKINIGDTVRMYSHVRQMLLIEDPYLLLCADTDGNGIVNIGDVVRSYVAIRNG